MDPRQAWRRGRDSNPRDRSRSAPLAGVCLRPLGHLSGGVGSSERRGGWQAVFGVGWRLSGKSGAGLCSADRRQIVWPARVAAVGCHGADKSNRAGLSSRILRRRTWHWAGMRFVRRYFVWRFGWVQGDGPLGKRRFQVPRRRRPSRASGGPSFCPRSRSSPVNWDFAAILVGSSCPRIS